MELSRREQLMQELEIINECYWDAQARLGHLAMARSEIMNQIQELDYEKHE